MQVTMNLENNGHICRVIVQFLFFFPFFLANSYLYRSVVTVHVIEEI